MKRFLKRIHIILLSILPLFLSACLPGVTKINQGVYSVQAQVVHNSNKKHYFFFMVDSLNSAKIVESLNVIKEENKNNSNKADITPELKEQGETMFNGWKMGLNVLSTGVRTEGGLSGAMGGAANNSTATQFGTRTTRQIYDDLYNGFIKNLVESKNIDKVYLETLEYFGAPEKNPQHARYNFKRDVKDPDKKIIWTTKKGASEANIENMRKRDWIKVADDVDGYANTFSFMISNIEHHNPSFTYNSKKHFMEYLLAFINRLKERKIYDNSEIIITSDHSYAYHLWRKKQDPNTTFAKMYGSRTNPFPDQIQSQLGNWYKNSGYNMYDYTDRDGTIPFSGISNMRFDKKELLDEKIYFEQQYSKKSTPQIFMASLLVKQIKSDLKKPIEIDDKNLFLNSDAIQILYHDIGIKTNSNKFNFYDYVNKNTKINSNGDLNSFVEDPLNTDLSKRRVFFMQKTLLKHGYGWGIYDSLNMGYSIGIFEGPFFTLSQDHKTITLNHNYRYFQFEKEDPNKFTVTWIERETQKRTTSTNPSGGLKFVHELILKLLTSKKSS